VEGQLGTLILDLQRKNTGFKDLGGESSVTLPMLILRLCFCANNCNLPWWRGLASGIVSACH
jgi:hypothetical protein